MKIRNVKASQWHKYESDFPAAIDRYYQKGFWKRNDKKKFIKRTLKSYDDKSSIPAN